MKKILLAVCLLTTTAAAVQAQEKPKVELSKEKKAALKKLKEEHLNASFTSVGLSEEQVAKAKAVLEDANRKSNELKESALNEEEKKAKKEVINDEKNSKLKEIIGEKWKEWQAIRKKQKAEEEEFAASAN